MLLTKNIIGSSFQELEENVNNFLTELYNKNEKTIPYWILEESERLKQKIIFNLKNVDVTYINTFAAVVKFNVDIVST